MKPISAYTATEQEALKSATILLEKELSGYRLTFMVAGSSFWIKTAWPTGGVLYFRAVYAMGAALTCVDAKENGKILNFSFTAGTGSYTTQVSMHDDKNILHYKTDFIPATDCFIPYFPRDIMPSFKNGLTQNTNGVIHAAQIGTRGG